MIYTFNLYPDVKRPKWLKKGMKVYCRGDGDKVLIVEKISVKGSRAFLLDEKGYAHGWESFSKLEQIPK